MVPPKLPAGYAECVDVLRYALSNHVTVEQACQALAYELALVNRTIRAMREYYLEGFIDQPTYEAFTALRDEATGTEPLTAPPKSKGRSRRAAYEKEAQVEAEIEEERVHTEEQRGGDGRILTYYFSIKKRDHSPLNGLFSRSEMESIYAQYPHVTVNQLTQSFPAYNSGEMRRILRAFGITKDQRFPPHIVEESTPDEAAEFALNAKERVAYKKLDLNRAGHVEKELRKAQDELWSLQEEQNVVNRLTTAILDRYIDEGRLTAAPPVPAYRPRFGEQRPVGEPALAFYGDCHFGKLFETEELMGRGRGTTRAILTQRLQAMAQEVVVTMHRLKTPELHLFNLGDVFESLLPQGMHDNHAMEMELKAEEQLRAAIEAHQLMFQYIHDHVNLPKGQQLRIVLHGLGGNHDRLGKSRDEDKRRTGAMIFYNMLELVLNYSLPGVVQVKSYPTGVFSVVAGSTNVIAFHGDSSLGKTRSTDILNRFRSGDSSLYTVIANGHWHATVVDEGHNYTRMTVGPVCSADDYVQNNLAKGSQPSVMFAEAAPGYGIDLHKKTLY
jgi:hypothetical protein